MALALLSCNRANQLSVSLPSTQLCMAEKETLTARMPADTYKGVEQYRQQRDLTKSDAGRRLIEAGLESKTNDSEPADSGLGPTDLGMAAMLVAVAFAVAGPLAGLGVAVAGAIGFVAGYYLDI